MGRTSVKRQKAYRDRERAKRERRGRTLDMLQELVGKVKSYPVDNGDGATGYTAYLVEGDQDFQDRFAAWAKEHGRTPREMLDEAMAIYLEEVQRLRDEQN